MKLQSRTVFHKNSDIVILADEVENENGEKETNEPEKKKTKVEKEKEKVNTEMVVGANLNHTMPKLSDYFDKFMINKNRHVPVSIFNVKWLLLDKNFMTTKRAKPVSCGSDTIPYIGLPIPSEWHLTSAEWSKRFDLMVRYHDTHYDKLPNQLSHPIAPRLIAHKMNVLQIQMEQQGRWLPAFRYDIAQRTNVWEHRLPDGRMSDVGSRNELLVKQALTDSEFAKDELFDDNPYAIGYTRQNQSPIDGQIYPEHHSWDGINLHQELQLEGTGGQLLSALNPIASGSSHFDINSQAAPLRSQKNRGRGGRQNFVQRGQSNGRGHSNGVRRTYPTNPVTNNNFGNTFFQPNNNQTRQNFSQDVRPAIGHGSFVPMKQLMLEAPVASGSGAEKGKGSSNNNNK